MAGARPAIGITDVGGPVVVIESLYSTMYTKQMNNDGNEWAID